MKHFTKDEIKRRRKVFSLEKWELIEKLGEWGYAPVRLWQETESQVRSLALACVARGGSF